MDICKTYGFKIIVGAGSKPARKKGGCEMRTVFVMKDHGRAEIVDPMNNIERFRRIRSLNSGKLAGIKRVELLWNSSTHVSRVRFEAQ